MVSDWPVETFVYLTLVHHKPFLIATGNGSHWLIENGRITRK